MCSLLITITTSTTALPNLFVSNPSLFCLVYHDHWRLLIADAMLLVEKYPQGSTERKPLSSYPNLHDHTCRPSQPYSLVSHCIMVTDRSVWCGTAFCWRSSPPRLSWRLKAATRWRTPSSFSVRSKRAREKVNQIWWVLGEALKYSWGLCWRSTP